MNARVLDPDTRPAPRSRTGIRPPRVIRVLLPALIILIWLVGAGVGGPYFGKVGEVSSNDQTTYLPESADATRVQEALGDFSDSDALPAVVVLTSSTPLTDTQIDQVQEAVDTLPGIDGVAEGTSPLLPSEDGRALEVFVPVAGDAEIGDVVSDLSQHLRYAMPAGIEVFVTGPAGFTADLVEAFSGIDGILLVVALLAVLVILIVVYRSLLLPIAVLSTSLFALTVALLAVWWLAKAEVLLLSGQAQGILFILVIGAATDYSLLYVARFREELR